VWSKAQAANSCVGWRCRPFSTAPPSSKRTDADNAQGSSTDLVEYIDDSSPITGLTLLPSFVTPAEQEELVRELDGVFQGKRYSFARHWDQVIIGYRECERSLFKFSAQNQRTIQRLNDAIGPGVNLFPHVHVLDIHEDGEMKPHIDSIKFSGGLIAGLSLLSPCVFELHHQQSPARVNLLLEPGSFYIMRGDARYEWAHGISKSDVAFKGRTVKRTRRLSLIMRDFKDDDIFPTPPPPPGDG